MTWMVRSKVVLLTRLIVSWVEIGFESKLMSQSHEFSLNKLTFLLRSLESNFQITSVSLDKNQLLSCLLQLFPSLCEIGLSFKSHIRPSPLNNLVLLQLLL